METEHQTCHRCGEKATESVKIAYWIDDSLCHDCAIIVTERLKQLDAE